MPYIVFILLVSLFNPVYAENMREETLVCSMEARSCGFLKSCDTDKCTITRTHFINRYGIPRYVTGSLSNTGGNTDTVVHKNSIFRTKENLRSIALSAKQLFTENKKAKYWGCFKDSTSGDVQCAKVKTCNDLVCRISVKYFVNPVKIKDNTFYEPVWINNSTTYTVNKNKLDFSHPALIPILINQQIENAIYRLNLN